jgi:hypothetical protein
MSIDSRHGDSETPLVPDEITKHTKQGYTSLLIEYLLGAEDVDEETILSNLGEQDKETKLRISRLYYADKFIEPFLQKINTVLSDEDQQGVKEALALMLKIHIDQPDRVDGSGPYITHPLKVALGILESYRGDHLADTVIAALLHDSVEDQAHLVELLHITDVGTGASDSQEFFALNGIEVKFGPDVAELVRMLSNDNDVTREDFSNTDYLEFVRGIVETTENHGPEAFAIKWQDARENMLRVGDLWRRAKHLRDEVAPTVQESRKLELYDMADNAEKLYKKLKVKYEPVLRDVFLPAFKEMSSEHLLYSLKDQAIQEIEQALEQEYNLDED